MTNQALKKQNITVERRESFTLPSAKGLLVVARQETGTDKLRKWLLIAPVGGLTALVSLEMPLAAKKDLYPEAAIRASFATLASRTEHPRRRAACAGAVQGRRPRRLPGGRCRTGPRRSTHRRRTGCNRSGRSRAPRDRSRAGQSAFAERSRQLRADSRSLRRPISRTFAFSARNRCGSAASPATKCGSPGRTRKSGADDRSGAVAALRQRRLSADPRLCAEGRLGRSLVTFPRGARRRGAALDLSVVTAPELSLAEEPPSAPPFDTATSAGRSTRSPIR